MKKSTPACITINNTLFIINNTLYLKSVIYPIIWPNILPKIIPYHNRYITTKKNINIIYIQVIFYTTLFI